MGIADNIEKLFELKEQGILTQEEFEREKNKLLDQTDELTDQDGSPVPTTVRQIYIDYWKYSFKWKGRANRPEYWWPFLINLIFALILGFLGAFIPVINLLSSIFSLATIFPTYAVYVRRFHDRGKNAWFAFVPTFVALISIPLSVYMFFTAAQSGGSLFLPVIPVIFLLVISIIWFVFLCLPGDKKANKYGNPRK